MAEEPVRGGEPQETASQVAARPEGVPEKFWDAGKGEVRTEQMIKSYGEMQKMVSSRPALSGTGVTIPTEEALPDDAGIDAVVLKAGLDPKKLGEEFQKEGRLSERMYDALKKVGYTKGVINDVLKTKIGLEQMQADAQRATAIQKVGGEEQLNNLLTWAKTNLGEAELASYNTLVSNKDTATQGFEWLVGKHKEAVGAGKTNPLIEGTVPAGGSVGAFTTNNELVAAMADERYEPDTVKHDPAYYKEVRQRLAVTDMSTLT